MSLGQAAAIGAVIAAMIVGVLLTIGLLVVGLELTRYIKSEALAVTVGMGVGLAALAGAIGYAILLASWISS